MTLHDHALSEQAGTKAASTDKQTAEQRLSVGLMKAAYSGGRAAVGSAWLPGRVAFDRTLSTPDIYTLARFATCHKTSAHAASLAHRAGVMFNNRVRIITLISILRLPSTPGREERGDV